MDASHYRFVSALHGDRIATALQRQQHLRPHQTLEQAIALTQEETGFCAQAGDRAIASLRLDPAGKIGRLKQRELIQLARTIYRLWQQNLAAKQPSGAVG